MEPGRRAQSAMGVSPLSLFISHPWLGLAVSIAGLVLGFLAKYLPAVLAIVCVEPEDRPYICLELIRLRRQDAADLPSYFPRHADADDAPAEAPAATAGGDRQDGRRRNRMGRGRWPRWPRRR